MGDREAARSTASSSARSSTGILPALPSGLRTVLSSSGSRRASSSTSHRASEVSSSVSGARRSTGLRRNTRGSSLSSLSSLKSSSLRNVLSSGNGFRRGSGEEVTDVRDLSDDPGAASEGSSVASPPLSPVCRRHSVASDHSVPSCSLGLGCIEEEEAKRLSRRHSDSCILGQGPTTGVEGADMSIRPMKSEAGRRERKAPTVSFQERPTRCNYSVRSTHQSTTLESQESIMNLKMKLGLMRSPETKVFAMALRGASTCESSVISPPKSSVSLVSSGLNSATDAMASRADREQSCRDQMQKWLLLPAIPLLCAFRNSWFSRTSQVAEVSLFLPAVGSSVLTIALLLLILAACFPVRELRALVDRKYVIMLVPGLLAGASRCLRDYSLSVLRPTVAALAGQSAGLMACPLQLIAFRMWPPTGQFAVLCAVPIAAPITVAVTMMLHGGLEEHGQDADTFGIAVGAGVSAAFAMFSVEVAAKLFTLETPPAKSTKPELLRTVVWHEVICALFSLGMALGLEWDLVSTQGPLGGWSTGSGHAVVMPGAIAAFAGNYMVYEVRAVGVAVFECLAAILTYGFEVALMPYAFHWDMALVLCVLTLQVLAYTKVGKDFIDSCSEEHLAVAAKNSQKAPPQPPQPPAQLHRQASRVRPALLT